MEATWLSRFELIHEGMSRRDVEKLLGDEQCGGRPSNVSIYGPPVRGWFLLDSPCAFKIRIVYNELDEVVSKLYERDGCGYERYDRGGGGSEKTE